MKLLLRTSACVGKKLGCAYGFGVGDCVDMRLGCDASRIERRLGGPPSFFNCGVDDSSDNYRDDDDDDDDPLRGQIISESDDSN